MLCHACQWWMLVSGNVYYLFDDEYITNNIFIFVDVKLKAYKIWRLQKLFSIQR